MKTANLIQAEANVVRITSLHEGDVVKILEKDYADKYKTIFGVVTALYNSGEKSYVELTTYEKSYSEVKGDIKIYAGDVDLNIFPATVEEVQNHLKEALQDIERSLERKKRDLQKEVDAFERAKLFVSGETSKQLRNASFKEITQAEYNQQKQQLLGQ